MDTVSLNSSANSPYSVEATAVKAREKREAATAASNEIAQENRQKSEARFAEAAAERKARLEQMQSSGNKIDTYA